MSHVVDIKTEITDLDVVKEVADMLGMTFVKNAKTYRWYGRSVGNAPLPEGFKVSDLGKCDHKLRMKNSNGVEFEVGVCRRKDGGKGFTLLYDEWGGDRAGKPIKTAMGKNGQNFIREYACAKVKKAARKKKIKVKEKRVGNTIKLTLSGGSL